MLLLDPGMQAFARKAQGSAESDSGKLTASGQFVDLIPADLEDLAHLCGAEQFRGQTIFLAVQVLLLASQDEKGYSGTSWDDSGRIEIDAGIAWEVVRLSLKIELAAEVQLPASPSK